MPSWPPGFLVYVAALSPFFIRLLSCGQVPVGPPAPEYRKHTAEQMGPVSSSLTASRSLLTNVLSGVLPGIPETVCCVPETP